MPSTYSPNLRIELIANGEQSGTWGSTTNNNLGGLLEQSISGYVDVVVSAADQALSALNGVSDQSRNMVVNFSSASSVAVNFTIYVPPAEKLYIFRNSTSYVATISAATTLNGITPTGGTAISIPANRVVMLYCDGASPNYNIRNALTYTASDFEAAGILRGDAAVLTTPLAATSGGTGFNAYVIGTLLYGNTTTTLDGLPPSTSGLVLKTQGTGQPPIWGQVDLTSAVTGNLPVTNLGSGSGASASSFWRGDGTWAAPGGSGNVNGPVSSTTNAIATYANTSGTLLNNNSGVTISSGTITATEFSGSISPADLSSAVPATKGGTAQTTYTTGDILYSSASNTLAKRAIGSTGQVLTVSGGVPAWATPAAGGVSSITGTASQITASASTGAVTLSLPSSVTISSIFTAGTIRSTGDITAFYSSDARLKENVVPIANALDLVHKIRGVRYDWTEAAIERKGGEDGYFTRKQDIGVIAQEVEAVFPEIVGTDADGFKGVKYERLVAVLLEAVKELKAEVDALKGAK